MFAVLSQHQPYINPALGGHTNAQLWAEFLPNYPNAVGRSTIELGWQVAPSQYLGNMQPHLFAFRFDGGISRGYAGPAPGDTGFTPYAPNQPNAFVNMVLPTAGPGAGWTYGIQLFQGNWWVYWGGYWVGYYPFASWLYQYPSWVNVLGVGGEVAHPNVHQPYDTQMGTGYFGINPPGYAAYVHQVYGLDAPAHAPTVRSMSNLQFPLEADCVYNVGNYYAAGGQFSYGGPGFSQALC